MDGKKIILLVEDDLTLRRSIGFFLEVEGFLVLEAGNGREALEVIGHSPPDLIVTDIMMPEMDGVQFYLTLKEDPASREIPVIALTVKNALQDHQYASYLGMDEYLNKPFDPQELMGKIRKLLEKY
ncbi:MAG: response regulator [bacterium]